MLTSCKELIDICSSAVLLLSTQTTGKLALRHSPFAPRHSQRCTEWARLLQKCYKSITEVLQKRYRSVTEVFQQAFPGKGVACRSNIIASLVSEINSSTPPQNTQVYDTPRLPYRGKPLCSFQVMSATPQSRQEFLTAFMSGYRLTQTTLSGRSCDSRAARIVGVPEITGFANDRSSLRSGYAFS